MLPGFIFIAASPNALRVSSEPDRLQLLFKAHELCRQHPDEKPVGKAGCSGVSSKVFSIARELIRQCGGAMLLSMVGVGLSMHSRVTTPRTMQG